MITSHIHTADAFFSLLRSYGVKRIFGIPGDELELFDALSHSGIEFITTRHEQAAAFMAEAVGKMSSLPGVCISTLGPGATNLVTGVADAYQNRAPVLVLSGQLPRDLHTYRPLAHQYVNLQKLFRPVTKATYVISDLRMMSRMVEDAIRIALDPKPGPVHLTLPIDVMEQKMPVRKRRRVSFLRELSTVPEMRIRQVVRLLSSSRFPVAFLGQEGHHCHPQLVRAFQRAGIPVITSFLGKGSFPENDVWSLGTISRHVKDALIKVLERADLFLVIGYDYIEGVDARIFQDTKTISMDTISARVGQQIRPVAGLVGDIRPLSFHLARAITWANYQSAWESGFIREVRAERYDQVLQTQSLDSRPINPFRIMQCLQAITTGKEMIVSDVGIHKQVIGLGYRVDRPWGVHFSNGLSSMGFALPFAAGLRFSVPSAVPIISISGDGGFLMNVQELETIRRYQLDVKIVILFDNAFGMIKANLVQKYRRVRNLDFGNPDFALLASSFGIPCVPFSPRDDVRHKLRTLLHTRGPALLAIPIQYS